MLCDHAHLSNFTWYEPLAQLVEHLPFKQRAVGSSPTRLSFPGVSLRKTEIPKKNPGSPLDRQRCSITWVRFHVMDLPKKTFPIGSQGNFWRLSPLRMLYIEFHAEVKALLGYVIRIHPGMQNHEPCVLKKQDPMKKAKKEIPIFASEQKEFDFWSTRDSM